ncbi:MAG TPA: MIP family channel protein [Acidiferrobacteraceae bacterium]|nr:MIP family channel protein [Acidiferrobacteraceae bacterium]HEX19528.1 MIP family channel protein [Acidiferrobacteraceae bacterium]
MNKYFCEFLGTFALVFAGTGAIVINDYSAGVITHLGIALVFGMVVMAMIYAVGDVSGAHINPAVTVAFWLAKRLPGREVAPYIISQVLGGLLASAILLLVFSGHKTLGATISSIDGVKAFGFEIVLTFLLMFVIIHVSEGAKEKGLMAGAAIGAMVGLEAMFAGPVTGASMNPARSLAPALVSGELQHLWIYLTAPFIGASLAILSCRIVRKEGCCVQNDNA